jgi:hypothetical protein
LLFWTFGRVLRLAWPFVSSSPSPRQRDRALRSTAPVVVLIHFIRERPGNHSNRELGRREPSIWRQYSIIRTPFGANLNRGRRRSIIIACSKQDYPHRIKQRWEDIRCSHPQSSPTSPLPSLYMQYIFIQTIGAFIHSCIPFPAAAVRQYPQGHRVPFPLDFAVPCSSEKLEVVRPTVPTLSSPNSTPCLPLLELHI